MRASKDVALDEQPGLNIAYFAMNNLKKPFGDPRVRQALALAKRDGTPFAEPPFAEPPCKVVP